jgi:Kef-type K+ transport system membrane component KefB
MLQPSLQDSATSGEILSTFWILLVVLIAPLLSRLTRGVVPEVVLLIAFGVLLGPSVLDIASADGGVAGYELDPDLLVSRTGRSAMAVWVVCAALGLAFAWFTLSIGDLAAAVAVAIALSSTALGTLLPILKDRGLLQTRLGRAVLAHGASGELLPVLAMVVLLSSRNVAASLILLALYTATIAAVATLPRHALPRLPRLATVLRERSHGTGQLVLRSVMLLLIGLMALAVTFDLDVVLGAFAAGAVLRLLSAELVYDARLEEKLEALAYGFFVPFFFVVSGIGIALEAVIQTPQRLVLAVLLIGLVRGVPVWVAERLTDTGSGLTTRSERAQLALFAATGLPIIVAVTQVAVSSDLMSAANASILVAAGAVTVLVFPVATHLVQRPRPGRAPQAR